MLYPQSNAYRSVLSLNGVWRFRTVEEGYLPLAPARGTRPMAVPASMNEIVVEKELKYHEGCVLYECEFSLPTDASRVYRLRIGATSHACKVYLNGSLIGEGKNGFYPIDLPLDALEDQNRLSVVIDNRLSDATLPVGEMKNGRQVIHFDFFNYTGIHRDVCVYSLPARHIRDVAIETVADGDYSKLRITADCPDKLTYTVLDAERNAVATSTENVFSIPSPKLWSPEHPYLYTLVCETESDRYEERFGIRKIEVKGAEFLLNDKPIYFKGFGMHEDFFVLGKGNNPAVTLRNFECMKWIGANSFRTSHYPYSEEFLSLADEYGFLVIDEVPAVGMNRFNGSDVVGGLVTDRTKALHKELISDLVARDKNHPSVVMLSIGNEPNPEEEALRDYYADIIDYAHTATNLPIMLVHCGISENGAEEILSGLPDVLGLNRYYGWYYHRLGDETDITESIIPDFKGIYEKHKKPILLTEFGADTIEGLHSLPAEPFSEEFQLDAVRTYGDALDTLPFVIGEQVWNFADFSTKPGLTRFRGNRKGVFTKDRQPKLVAHFLKERWSKK